MMKHEFDELVGITTAPEAWERIEFVYMNDEEFQTKQQIADFYKEKDMNGIEWRRDEIIRKATLEKEFQGFIKDLAFFSSTYVAPIKQHLAEIAFEIYKDKTTVKLLHEYHEREEKEQEELVQNFAYYFRNEVKPLWDNHCSTYAAHFKTVIEELTFRQWWHEHSKDFE